MRSYFIGFIKHLFNRRISNFALVDADSKISKKARVYYLCKIHKSGIGAYTYIAPRTSLSYAHIGKFCSVASDCSIGLPSHAMENLSTSPLFTSRDNATGIRWVEDISLIEHSKVTVGHDVWIGTKVIIKGGIKIGHGSIIGAGSIVTHDLPDYSVSAGVPARVIRYRFEEQVIARLLDIQWWDLPKKDLLRNIDVFKKEGLTVNDLEGFH